MAVVSNKRVIETTEMLSNKKKKLEDELQEVTVLLEKKKTIDLLKSKLASETEIMVQVRQKLTSHQETMAEYIADIAGIESTL